MNSTLSIGYRVLEVDQPAPNIRNQNSCLKNAKSKRHKNANTPSESKKQTKKKQTKKKATEEWSTVKINGTEARWNSSWVNWDRFRKDNSK